MTEDGRSSKTVLSRESTRRPFAAYGSEMQQARHQLQESLKELEHDTLGALDMAAQQLDHARESVSLEHVELAATVITHNDRNDGRYLQPALGAYVPLACILRLPILMKDLLSGGTNALVNS